MSTLQDTLVLAQGTRAYKFAFTDDWGRQTDLSDRVPGETTTVPAASGAWIQGPTVTQNNPPYLYNGTVTSQDGTANSATLWTFGVTYKDIDNDPPTLIEMFLGLLQPDGKTILWDSGHLMTQNNPADVVYSDGVDYNFQTRLTGWDNGQPQAPQYDYRFAAYDGAAWATFDTGCLAVCRNAARLSYQDYRQHPLPD